ncbi:formimidoylglutamate deiminase [Pectobacterium parmentieri]|uniref:formimidoylglutamate deiminase n=1 Tax=Pectobacterium parmentieri TaxID=1905730 RepID=UPI0001B0C02E|nr:formimidoylglutamate deiminase [Pectobacterium parmentieri]ACX90249.1 formiminoglutamate deiminase [Pectobacterium parmentieri WPP163]AYH03627.1 formimidoylglutamate deiminase [Pectobacterium parmentieri]AYH29884.1 formimidoylglutamate deiminase [Pectobacterium parmentieri]AYH34303.1 formimidoylglutamate deiminase [Pectobacterium parmentieri]MBI0517962.1 formimidoylglutamate deiminase [Pectobacterium parmentieri]
MTVYFATKALLPQGWADNVRITVSTQGMITALESGSQADDNCMCLDGFLVPGMPNLHSHAFQRVMAGLTEVVGDPADSFWTWRDLMYRLVDKITPEQLETIASYLYIEMLKAGYTSVAEFHYLHHDRGGKPYAQPAELALRISQAAKTAGIGLTLLPVLYSFSGFGGQAATTGQSRFIHDTESYLALHETLTAQLAAEPMQRTGLCFHSLRAVTPEQMQSVLKASPQPQPIHIHIAEQQKEVDDCVAWSALRPVEWLYRHMPVDEQWCLVHATHLTRQETQQIAASGAVTGLCLTTEANLGDGIFPGPDYLEQKGRWGIGSDSHISVSVSEDLRWFEYGQRLNKRRRNLLHLPDEPYIGNVLYQGALQGGRRALGQAIGQLSVGDRADMLLLDSRDPFLATASDRERLNRWIFACSTNPIKRVMTGGRWVIENGQHPYEDKITADFIQVMKRIVA